MGLIKAAFCGQEERQDAHPLARLLDLLIVLTNEGARQLGDMKGGRYRETQEPVAFAMQQQAFTAPVEELGRDGTHRASIYKTQPHLLAVGEWKDRPDAKAPHTTPTLWDQDRPSAEAFRSDAAGLLHLARREPGAEQNETTRPHPGNQWPNLGEDCKKRSADHARFFYLVRRIGTGNPVFGPFPIHA
jgi:hypothetical protein